MANLTIPQAAAAIVALINARPHSPRPEEIEAIIARTAAPVDDEAMQALAEWDAALRLLLPTMKGNADEVYECANEALHARCEAIWAKPVRNLGDLYVRIAMAVHWNGPLPINDPPYPDDVIADDPETNTDARSLAFLVRGLLDITGLRFDQDGRLLSMEASNG